METMETTIDGLVEDLKIRVQKIVEMGLTFRGYINENAPEDDPPVGIVTILFKKPENQYLDEQEKEDIIKILKEGQDLGSSVHIEEFDGDSCWVTQYYYY